MPCARAVLPGKGKRRVATELPEVEFARASVPCARAVLPCKGKRRVATELPEVEKTQARALDRLVVESHWIATVSPSLV